MEFDVDKCPRCGGTHLQLRFKKLTTSSALHNVWATCPESKEPILGYLGLSMPEQTNERRTAPPPPLPAAIFPSPRSGATTTGDDNKVGAQPE